MRCCWHEAGGAVPAGLLPTHRASLCPAGPLNETSFLPPWWQRTVIRSTCVLVITLLSILIVSGGLSGGGGGGAGGPASAELRCRACVTAVVSCHLCRSPCSPPSSAWLEVSARGRRRARGAVLPGRYRHASTLCTPELHLSPSQPALCSAGVFPANNLLPVSACHHAYALHGHQSTPHRSRPHRLLRMPPALAAQPC